eukprot:TRINITY_DN42894_c0_g1_i1.p1 TRINITY_DN42894_c0_g1~~TRINITY_DN42894_c0_g1_i1.p1  ORF type:complete len:1330 (+),score=302.19 TRINITY_DN42894_c0_g1_i1:176-3991(+)
MPKATASRRAGRPTSAEAPATVSQLRASTRRPGSRDSALRPGSRDSAQPGSHEPTSREPAPRPTSREPVQPVAEALLEIMPTTPFRGLRPSSLGRSAEHLSMPAISVDAPGASSPGSSGCSPRSSPPLQPSLLSPRRLPRSMTQASDNSALECSYLHQSLLHRVAAAELNRGITQSDAGSEPSEMSSSMVHNPHLVRQATAPADPGVTAMGARTDTMPAGDLQPAGVLTSTGTMPTGALQTCGTMPAGQIGRQGTMPADAGMTPLQDAQAGPLLSPQGSDGVPPAFISTGAGSLTADSSQPPLPLCIQPLSLATPTPELPSSVVVWPSALGSPPCSPTSPPVTTPAQEREELPAAAAAEQPPADAAEPLPAAGADEQPPAAPISLADDRVRASSPTDGLATPVQASSQRLRRRSKSRKRSPVPSSGQVSGCPRPSSTGRPLSGGKGPSSCGSRRQRPLSGGVLVQRPSSGGRLSQRPSSGGRRAPSSAVRIPPVALPPTRPTSLGRAGALRAREVLSRRQESDKTRDQQLKEQKATRGIGKKRSRQCEKCGGKGRKGGIVHWGSCAHCGGSGELKIGARVRCMPQPVEGQPQQRRVGRICGVSADDQCMVEISFDFHGTRGISKDWWLHHAEPVFVVETCAEDLLRRMAGAGAAKDRQRRDIRVNRSMFLAAMRKVEVRDALLWVWSACEHVQAGQQQLSDLALWFMLAGEVGKDFGVEALRRYLEVARLFLTIANEGDCRGVVDAWKLERALHRHADVRKLLGVGPDRAELLFQKMDVRREGSVGIVEFWAYLRSKPIGDWRNIEDIGVDRLCTLALDGVQGATVTEEGFSKALTQPELEMGLCINASEAAEWFSQLRGARGYVRKQQLLRFVRARWAYLKADPSDSGHMDPFALGEALLHEEVQRTLMCRPEECRNFWWKMDKRAVNRADFWTFFQQVPDEVDDDIFRPRPYKAPARPQDKYGAAVMIGEGGYGVVSVANRQHPPDGLQIVMKELRPGADQEKVETNRREADILRRFRHPHLVRLSDTFEREPLSDTSFVIVLEHCSGGDLWQHMKRRRKESLETWSADESCRLFTQIMSGLAYLHERDCVHRDVKPGNVLLTSQTGDAEAKLADFGLLHEAVRHEGFLTVCGTPGYMAPETLLDAATPDSSADSCMRTYGKPNDVWAAGCIAVEMVSGSPPFTLKHSEAFAALREIAGSGVLPSRIVEAAAATWVEGILSKTLDPNPEDRWTAGRMDTYCAETWPVQEPASGGVVAEFNTSWDTVASM